MPQLFDVPGWSVPEPSGNPSSKKSSKKRKRPSSDTSSKLLSAEFNLEKLMEKLKETTMPKGEMNGESSKKIAGKRSKKNKKHGKKLQSEELPTTKPTLERKISTPKPLQPRGKAPKDIAKASQESARPAKRVKTDHVAENPSPKKAEKKAEKKVEKKVSVEESGLTDMQRRMKEKLDGAKFRCVYTTLHQIRVLTLHSE